MEEEEADEMNQLWQALGSPMPIVEVHDVRTEPGRAADYLRLLEGPLAESYPAQWRERLGDFRVDLHEERIISLRGYPDLAARRRSLEAFHASAAWNRHRAELHAMERSHEVILTRAVSPSSGTRPLLPGTGYGVLISELRHPEQLADYHLWLRLLLRKSGLDPLLALATLEAANDVPAVPVVRNRTHHVALIPEGGRPPKLPPELLGRLRFAPEILSLKPQPLLVW